MSFDKYYHGLKVYFLSHKYPFLLALIIILGLFLRLVNIGTEPYWCDELLSLGVAKHYLGDPVGLWNYVQLVDIHPPLYYYMLDIWIGWFGPSEAATRSLSLIFSLGVIGLVYYLGKILFKNKKIALIAAFICTILPMQIEYGQEARPYAIYCFFGLLSIIALGEYMETDQKKKKIILVLTYALASIVGLYLHYSFLLVIIPTASYWLLRVIIKKSGREFVWWLATMAIIFLGFYPWFAVFIFKSLMMDKVVENSERMITSLRARSLIESSINQLIWADKSRKIEVVETLVQFIFKLFFLGGVAWILIKNKSGLIKYKKQLLYLGWFLVTSLTLFVILPNSIDYTDILERHLITTSAILSFFLAGVILGLKNKKMTIIGMLLFITSLATFDMRIMGDDSIYDINNRYNIMADYINQQYQEGDLALVYYGIVRTNMNYYLDPKIPGFKAIYPYIILGEDFLESRETLGFIENEFHLRQEDELKQGVLDAKMNYFIKKYKPKRVWVVFGEDKIKYWFKPTDWRMAFRPIGKLFPVSLYVRKTDLLK